MGQTENLAGVGPPQKGLRVAWASLASTPSSADMKIEFTGFMLSSPSPQLQTFCSRHRNLLSFKQHSSTFPCLQVLEKMLGKKKAKGGVGFRGRKLASKYSPAPCESIF